MCTPVRAANDHAATLPLDADGRPRVDALPGRQRRLPEIRILADTREREAVPVPFAQRHERLRHAVVGDGLRLRRILQRLEALRAREDLPRPVGVGEAALARQRGLRREADAVGQIREVGVVGHLVQVPVADEAGQPGIEVLRVPPGELVPVRAGDAVVRQVFRAHLAL